MQNMANNESIDSLPLPTDIVVQRIKAKNDQNGNPRRIFHVYDTNLIYLGWVDEGYEGETFMRGRNVTSLLTIRVNKINPYRLGTEFKNQYK